MSGLLARQRFFFNLALPAASFLLIVASVAFGRGGAKGAGLAIGIAECAGSLLSRRRSSTGRVPSDRRTG